MARLSPEILARWESGEFKSVRAAAITAGIVKVKTPLDQLRSWWKKASPEEQLYQNFLAGTPARLPLKTLPPPGGA
jgi:hypothetical protein